MFGRHAWSVLFLALAVSHAGEWPEEWALTDEQRSGPYLIRTFRWAFGSAFQILEAGQVVHEQKSTDGEFYIGADRATGGQELRNRIPPGTDITGDGIGDLVISHWSGGGHCCATAHVFSLESVPRKIAAIQGWEPSIGFRDINGDERFEVEVWDAPLHGIHQGLVGFVPVRVILRFEMSGYQPAPDLMWRPAPAQEEIRKLAKNFSLQFAQESDGRLVPSSEFLRQILEWMYSGNERSALELIELCWPAEKGKDEFLTLLYQRLDASAYWRQVKWNSG